MIHALLLLLLAQEPVFKLPSAAPEEYTPPADFDFEADTGAELPREWSLVPQGRLAGFTAARSTKGCRTGAGCAVISAGAATEKGSEAGIVQQFDAEPYQGRRMRLSAWVRLENGGRGDWIKLSFAATGDHGEASFTQKGRGVDSSEWTQAEVIGKVPFRAETIQILIAMRGKGRAWIDDVAFEPVE
jgi:hypothetical protein